MTQWNQTAEAAEWIATADSRETSIEIMQAIAFFARSKEEAERVWENGPDGVVCDELMIWENVTQNGLRSADEFFWGAAGNHWIMD
jgi:hypothetical protein